MHPGPVGLEKMQLSCASLQREIADVGVDISKAPTAGQMIRTQCVNDKPHHADLSPSVHHQRSKT